MTYHKTNPGTYCYDAIARWHAFAKWMISYSMLKDRAGSRSTSLVVVKRQWPSEVLRHCVIPMFFCRNTANKACSCGEALRWINLQIRYVRGDEMDEIFSFFCTMLFFALVVVLTFLCPSFLWTILVCGQWFRFGESSSNADSLWVSSSQYSYGKLTKYSNYNLFIIP